MITPRLPQPVLRSGRLVRGFVAALALPALLAGCAVYPDGRLGPLPAAPAVAYPAPAVAYPAPAYGYGDGYAPPAYYAPPPPVYYAPPPVVVAPSIGLGFNWGGRGHYGGRYHGRRW